MKKLFIAFMVLTFAFSAVYAQSEMPKTKKKLKAQYANLLDENQNLTQMLEAYQNTIDSLKNANSGLTSDILTKNLENAKAFAENKTLEEQNKKITEDHDALLKDIELLNGKISGLETQLANAKKDYKNLSQTSADEAKALQDKIDALTAEIGALTAKINELNKEREEFVEALECYARSASDRKRNHGYKYICNWEVRNARASYLFFRRNISVVLGDDMEKDFEKMSKEDKNFIVIRVSRTEEYLEKSSFKELVTCSYRKYTFTYVFKGQKSTKTYTLSSC